jgi:hypothetical protein
VADLVRRRRSPLLAALVASLALVAGCGGGGAPEAASTDPGPEHVHGLGVNPADGALYLAAHTGLFVMAPGSDEAERVGDRMQDTMGFVVAGPDRFLGSGHPDLRDDLPPLLGLIESSDGGRSWDSVSLLGEADFHALRTSGARVAGYDSASGRIMVSDDGGRSWATVHTPAEPSDLVLDPDDPRMMIAAGGAGVMATRDGSSWTRLPVAADLLAWPAADALYGVASDGAVSVSPDGGRSWRRVGSAGGAPAALTAVDRDTLIVALHDGRLTSSADGGASWTAGAWAGEG